MMKIDEDIIVSVETAIDIIETDPEIQRAEPFFIYGNLKTDVE